MIQIVQMPLAPQTTSTNTQQTVSNVLPQVQSQAVAPISAKAVTPTARSEKGQKTRNVIDKEKEEASEEGAPDEGTNRGKQVNISV